MQKKDATKLKATDRVFVKRTGEHLVVESVLQSDDFGGTVYVTAVGPVTGRQEWQHTLLGKNGN